MPAFTVNFLTTILAFAAGVDRALIDARTDSGAYRYRAGRNKYLAVGALVWFFSLFSGLGMYHLLLGLPGSGIVTALSGGLLWAAFQFWLEKVILGAIPEQAGVLARLWGGGWRVLIGSFSALTMSYPFYVAINRPEIDVHILAMAQTRQEAALASSRQAAGLPALESGRVRINDGLQRIQAEQGREPDDIAALRRGAEACLDTLRTRETSLHPRLAQLEAERRLAQEGDARTQAIQLAERIGQIRLQLRNQRAGCDRQALEHRQRRQAWQNGLRQAQEALRQEAARLQGEIAQASRQAEAMHQEHARRIHLAAQGFVADFNAVHDLVRGNEAMRVNALSLYLWFMLIEISAIAAKLARKTDLDARMAADEAIEIDAAAHDLALRKTVSETERLLARAESDAMQAWLAEDGRTQLQETLRAENTTERQLQAIARTRALLEATCANLETTEALAGRGERLTPHTGQKLRAAIERAVDVSCEGTERALANLA